MLDMSCRRKDTVILAKTKTSLLLALILLNAGAACHSSGGSAVLTVGGEEGVRQIRSLDLERSMDRALAAEVQGVRLEVHHEPGNENSAREALHLLTNAVGSIGRFYDQSLAFTIKVYLVTLQPNEEPLAYRSEGGTLTLILPAHNQEEELLDRSLNATLLCQIVPHELTHLFQISGGTLVEDAWLGEGVPELLADRFRQRHCHDFMPFLRDGEPPIVALHLVAIAPWQQSKFGPASPWAALREALGGKDESSEGAPVRPEVLPEGFDESEYESLKYAASLALVERLLEAAAEHGSEDPLSELMAAIHTQDRLDWEDAQNIARSLTGHTLTELGKVPEEDLARARRQAWARRADPRSAQRLRALVTLRHLGLPPHGNPDDLLEALDLPPEHGPQTSSGRILLRGATAAMAATGDTDLALQAVARLKSRITEIHRVVAPELWGLLVTNGHTRLALEPLKAAIRDPGLTEDHQREAKEILKRARTDS